MIYVLTPFYRDFKQVCIDNNLVPSPEIIWVNHMQVLLGRKIFPTDKIIKGDQYYCFDPVMHNAITMELALRSPHIKNQKKAKKR